MKTKSLILAVASIFALSSIAFAGAQFVNNGPAVGIHKVGAKTNDRDTGNLKADSYTEHAMNSHSNISDRELGIGKYNERS